MYVFESRRTTYGYHIVLKCCSSVDIYRNFKFPEISKSSGGRGGAAAEGAMAAALGEKEWAQESPLVDSAALFSRRGWFREEPAYKALCLLSDDNHI